MRDWIDDLTPWDISAREAEADVERHDVPEEFGCDVTWAVEGADEFGLRCYTHNKPASACHSDKVDAVLAEVAKVGDDLQADLDSLDQEVEFRRSRRTPSGKPFDVMQDRLRRAKEA